LSRKALEKDPWLDAGERFPVGSKVSGRIARLQPFGAFVELAPGIDGLVHISEMSDRRIAHPKDVVAEGAEVQVTVLAVEPERKRIALTLKDHASQAAAEEEPERRPQRREGGERRPRPEREARPERPRYEEGAVLDATVEKIEAFGVFVTLPGGGRALVPNMELGTQKGADHRKIFPVGSALKVALIAADHRGQLRASKIEAEKAEERAAVRDWAATQKGSERGGGFGTSMADLLRKANLVK